MLGTSFFFPNLSTIKTSSKDINHHIPKFCTKLNTETLKPSRQPGGFRGVRRKFQSRGVGEYQYQLWEYQLWGYQCEKRKEGAIEFEVRDYSSVRPPKPPTN